MLEAIQACHNWTTSVMASFIMVTMRTIKTQFLVTGVYKTGHGSHHWILQLFRSECQGLQPSWNPDQGSFQLWVHRNVISIQLMLPHNRKNFIINSQLFIAWKSTCQHFLRVHQYHRWKMWPSWAGKPEVPGFRARITTEKDSIANYSLCNYPLQLFEYLFSSYRFFLSIILRSLKSQNWRKSEIWNDQF